MSNNEGFVLKWDNDRLDDLIEVIMLSDTFKKGNVIDYDKLAEIYNGVESSMALRLVVMNNWSYIDYKLNLAGLDVLRTRIRFPLERLPELIAAVNNSKYQNSIGFIQWKLINSDLFPELETMTLRKIYRYYIQGKAEQ